MKTITRILSISTLSLSFLLGQLHANQTWTDRNGNTMQAVFIETMEQNGETIVIFSREGIRYQVPISRLADEDQKRIRAGNTAAPAETAAKSPPAELTDFEREAREGLLRNERNKLVEANLGDTPMEWYAFYFSAGWCPPCRAFTPDLVKFYNRFKRRYPNFELIFVSSDRSEEDMEKYVKDYKMDFPFYPFGKAPASVKRLRGKGIPCLVFVDRNGKILADSYTADGVYLGPRPVLAEMEKTFRQ